MGEYMMGKYNNRLGKKPQPKGGGRTHIKFCTYNSYSDYYDYKCTDVDIAGMGYLEEVCIFFGMRDEEERQSLLLIWMKEISLNLELHLYS